MYELVEGICKLNDAVWQNKHGSYDDFLSSSMQIEEALEGLGDIPYLATRLHSNQESNEENFSPRECSRQIVHLATMDNKEPLSDVARFDKLLDAIYIAIGDGHKLGCTPEMIVDGLQVVHTANEMKGSTKDEHGKIIKPDMWEELYAPEPKLQEILDRRV